MASVNKSVAFCGSPSFRHQWQPPFYRLPDPSSPQLSRGKLKINSELAERQRETGNNLDFLRGVVITTPIFIHSSLVFRE